MRPNSMRRKRYKTRLALVTATVLFLGACAETKFVMHTAKRLGETNKSQGDYKVGKPYVIDGVRYYPKEDMNYDETGIASWYGPNFHGKKTANGEIFDQWEVSAAHKTLPMPSIVRVTNMSNGRSLVLRINDRGPFKPGRIIDLSRRAAQLLDVEKVGTAPVRVQILARESLAAKQSAIRGGTQLAVADSPIKATDVGSQPVATQPLPAPPQPKTPSKLYVQPQPVQQSKPVQTASAQPAPVTQEVLSDASIIQASPQAKVGEMTQTAATPTRMYIQAGAFSNVSNAERVQNRLASIGQVRVTPVSVSGRELYRVRLGPIADVAHADILLAQVVEAGYANARTVVERVETN